jgi:tetratricopeptide (TPR) repeat protein
MKIGFILDLKYVSVFGATLNMVIHSYNLRPLILLLLLLVFPGRKVAAQDFGECQQLLKELLPIFNRSFEENSPQLLREEGYQRTLHKLQAAYLKFNKEAYSTEDSVQRMNNEAVILALAGNYSKALHLMEGLTLPEKDPQMQYNRGLFKLLARRYESARTDFETSPGVSNAKVNTLVAYGKQKQYTEAINFANTSSGKNAGGKWSYNLGMVHKFTGHLEEGVSEMTAAIRQKDDVMAYRLQRGDMLMKNGNEKKAVKDFEKVARKHAKAQIRYANALLSTNQFASARAIFEKYLESGERTFKGDAYLGMAHANYGLNNISEALRYYRLASTMKRETPALLAGIGNVHLSRHEYQFAFNQFDRVLRKDTTYLPAYLGRAVAYYGLGKYDLALKDFKRAEKAMDENNKFHADLFVTRGFSSYYLNKSNDAQQDFTKAIRLDGTRYEALAGMSGIMIDQKQYAEAGQFLAKALQYEQTYDKMWSNYGNLLLHFDMFTKGYQVFKKAVSLNPANIKAQNGWGVVLLENDQLDKSITLFDSLVKEHPELPFLQNNRGIVQAYIGNRHEQKREIVEADARYDGAFADFSKGMEVAPAKKFYNVNQGNVYRYWQQYDEAKLSYQSYQDKSALNNTAVMFAGQNMLREARYYLGVALQIDSLHRVFQYNMTILAKGKQKEMMKLVASNTENSPFSDIGIKYSRDGFVTIYLYDYEYDKLNFLGRHFMPLPVAEYNEDYFIPEYDFKLIPYSKKKNNTRVKKARYKSQKVKMPGRRARSGTQCPVF